MAGARALMQASGVAREDFGKPIIAVANSFSEFVPGHTHLAPVGRIPLTTHEAGRLEPVDDAGDGPGGEPHLEGESPSGDRPSGIQQEAEGLVVGRVEPEPVGNGLVEQDRLGAEIADQPVEPVVGSLA